MKTVKYRKKINPNKCYKWCHKINASQYFDRDHQLFTKCFYNIKIINKKGQMKIQQKSLVFQKDKKLVGFSHFHRWMIYG